MLNQNQTERSSVGKAARAHITINGRKYDAITGKLISEPTQNASAQKPKTIPHNQGVSIDGVVKTQSPSRLAHAVHSRNKKATTLHRQAVATAKPKQKQIAPATQQTKTQLSQSQRQRYEKAMSVQKSQSISKFSKSQSSALVPQTIESPQPEPVAPEPIAPSEPASAPVSPKEAMIAQHLAQISLAPEPEPSMAEKFAAWFRQPKHTTVLASLASALILVGYITYINIPNMALRVASARAGFSANLPAYQPAGFSFEGPLAYTEGEVTIQFNSNSDDRHYTIVQKESSMDSQSLLETIEPQAELYPATYQQSGLTIYVYDGRTATWVNGGIWYTIDNESARLTTEQMLKIAASL